MLIYVQLYTRTLRNSSCGQQKRPRTEGAFVLNSRSWLVALDFCADLRDEAGCRILSAETECKTKSKRERYHYARKERLQYALRDLELRERCKNAEDPDRPAGGRAGEPGCGDACGASRTRNHPLRYLGDNRGDKKDKDRNDDVREERHHYRLQEEGYLREVKYLESRDQEHEDDEPAHQSAQECAGVQMIACAAYYIVYTRALKRVVDPNGAYRLRDDVADKPGNYPTNNEHYYREHKVRDKSDDGRQHAVERLLKHGHPILHDHTKNFNNKVNKRTGTSTPSLYLP